MPAALASPATSMQESSSVHSEHGASGQFPFPEQARDSADDDDDALDHSDDAASETPSEISEAVAPQMSTARHGFSGAHQSEAYLRELETVWFLYWTDPRHDPVSRKPPELPIIEFRGRDRVKTSQAALVLCLRIGCEPPDVVKTDPCARMECWVDPSSISAEKALEQIGKQLQRQYESLAHSSKVKYRTQLDPSVDETKKTAMSLRRQAKNERVLYHYNGHGVPKPTESGDIWVFNRQYTQYMPVPLANLLTWLETPILFVWDCSNAGQIVNKVIEFGNIRDQEDSQAVQNENANNSNDSQDHPQQRPLPSPRQYPFSDTIQLAACQANQTLPMNPSLPADLFTACLTSPVQMAVHYFILRNPLQNDLELDLAFKIPGTMADRKTPFGELNWIFVAITDTIAWNSLPKELFQKLFRNDLVIAALFRGFILAERIMRQFNCTPISVPALPQTHNHPLWDAWDLAMDHCVSQLPPILKNSLEIEEAKAAGKQAPPEIPFSFSKFFSDQLTAFEIWLDQGAARCLATPVKIITKDGRPTYAFKHSDGSIRAHPPRAEQLPIVLQVLLSQQHRLRALILLCKFLDLGFWAVDLSLSIGIFPYVLKLLQAPGGDLKPVLIYIWARIIGICRTSQDELFRQVVQPVRGQSPDLPYQYFVRILASHSQTLPIPNVSEHRAMCAFVLALFCRGLRPAQEACMQRIDVAWRGPVPPPSITDEAIEVQMREQTQQNPNATTMVPQNVLEACLGRLSDTDPLLRQWAALCISQLYDDYDEAKGLAIRLKIHEKFHDMLAGRDGERELAPEVRASVVYALGTLVGASGSEMLPPLLRASTEADLSNYKSATPISSSVPPSLGANSNTFYSKQSKRPHIRSCFSGAATEKTGLAAHEQLDIELGVAMMTLKMVTDGSPLVRRELVVLLSVIVRQHLGAVVIAAYEDFERENSSSGDKAESGRVSSTDMWTLLEKEEQQRQENLKAHAGDGLKDDYDDVPAAASSSPAFRSIIFSCIYKSLLDLAADPYPEVAEPASQVIDAIHEKLFYSKLASAEDSILIDITESVNRDGNIKKNESSPHVNLSDFSGPSVGSNDGISKIQPHASDKKSTFTSAVLSLAGLGFSEPSHSKSKSSESLSEERHAHYDEISDTEPEESDGGNDPKGSVSKIRGRSQAHDEDSLRSERLRQSKSPEVLSKARAGLPRSVSVGAALHGGKQTRRLDEGDSTNGIHSHASRNTSIEEAKESLLQEDKDRAYHMRKARSRHKKPLHSSQYADNYSPNEVEDEPIDEDLPPACRKLPLQSDFFDSCSRNFTEPQMKSPEADEPGSVSFNERLWRRDRSDKVITATQPLKDVATTTRWDEQVDLINNGVPMTKAVFHQFEPHLLTADTNGYISVHDWKTNTRINRFSNDKMEIMKRQSKYPSLYGNLDKRSREITAMRFINEEDIALLMTGSADGSVRIFKKYDQKGEVELVSSFRALNDIVPSQFREAGIVVEWQQGRGHLLTGGNVKSMSVWDAPREICIQDIPTRSNACMTSITSDQVAGEVVIAGFGDSTVRVYDRRLSSRDAMVRAWKGHHTSWVENVHMQRGGGRELVSASTSGEVCMWDIRLDDPIQEAEAYRPNDRHSLTSLGVHEHAPVFATCSDLGSIKVWNIKNMKPVSIWNTEGKFFGRQQRRVGMRSVIFHPHHLMMATVMNDANVGVYQCALDSNPNIF